MDRVWDFGLGFYYVELGFILCWIGFVHWTCCDLLFSDLDIRTNFVVNENFEDPMCNILKLQGLNLTFFKSVIQGLFLPILNS